jgi:hypothetical protein
VEQCFFFERQVEQCWQKRKGCGEITSNDTSPSEDAKPNQAINESYQAYWATQPQPTSVTQQGITSHTDLI